MTDWRSKFAANQSGQLGLFVRLLSPLLSFLLMVGLIAGIGAGAMFGILLFTGGANSQVQAQQQQAAAQAAGAQNICDTTQKVTAVSQGELPRTVPEIYRNLFKQASKAAGTDTFALATVFWIINNKQFPEPPAPYGKGKAWPSTGRGKAGPFQLSPNIWKVYGVDINKDKKADVNDLVEASSGAAIYLKNLGAVPGAPLGDPAKPEVPGTIINALASFAGAGEGNFNTPGMKQYLSVAVKEYNSLVADGIFVFGNNPAANADFLGEKIVQTFILGFDASTPKNLILDIVTKFRPGGIYIVGTKDAVAAGFDQAFFSQLKKAAGNSLIIASDEEGGQIKNFAYPEDYPSAKTLGQQSLTEVKATGSMVAKQLKADGVTAVLGPVLDISSGRTDHSGPNTDVINGYERSFSSDPNEVASHASALAEAFTAAGLTPVFKHWPGLGFGTGPSGNDSDHDKVIGPTLTELKNRDLVPYGKVLSKFPKAMVMLSNEYVPDVEKGRSASTSGNIIKLLRDDYKFNGVITTDNLNVPSVTDNMGSLESAVTTALQEGVTMPLFDGLGNDQAAAEKKLQGIIDTAKQAVTPAVIDAAMSKILIIKPELAATPLSVPVVGTRTTPPAPVTSKSPAFPFPTGTAAPTFNFPVFTTGSATTSSSSPASTPATSSSQAAPAGTALNTGDNAAVVYSYFATHPLPDGRVLTPEMISGIIGNQIKESGIEPQRLQSVFDRLIKAADIAANIKSGTGYGIVQWTPYSKMVDPMVAAGKDPNKMLDQLDFLFGQLTNTGVGAASPETGALDQLLTATSPEDAAYKFAAYYERFFTPGSETAEQLSSIELRKAAARAIYENATKGTALPADIKSQISVSAAGTQAAAGPVAATCPLSVLQAGYQLPFDTLGKGGQGCKIGTNVLAVPTGGAGTPVCYFSQGQLSGSSYNWPGCGCLPTSVLIIQSTMENNPKLDANSVQQAVSATGGLDSDGCSGVYTGALAYFKSIGYDIKMIKDHPGSDHQNSSTDAELAAVAKALGEGYLILTHTGDGSETGGTVDSAGNSTNYTKGHYLVVRAVDAQGNFYVANPGASADSQAVVSPARMKTWLNMYYAIKKP